MTLDMLISGQIMHSGAGQGDSRVKVMMSC